MPGWGRLPGSEDGEAFPVASGEKKLAKWQPGAARARPVRQP
jgi:hypothetical protein